MKTELKKAELTDSEITVLVSFYEEALRETEKCKSPIILEQRGENEARLEEIQSYRDGRCWNRGPGRKRKAQPDPPPALPMENNPLVTNTVCNALNDGTTA